ncbi:unnamed protein product [Choristocarpus tenellus]
MGKTEREGVGSGLLQYLRAAKATLDDRVYTSLIYLVNSYHGRMTDTDDLILGASELFSAHPHLLIGLKTLIPESDHPRIDDVIRKKGSAGVNNEGKTSLCAIDRRPEWSNLHNGTERTAMQDSQYPMLHGGRLGLELGEGESRGDVLGARAFPLNPSSKGGGVSSSHDQCSSFNSCLESLSLPPPGGGTTSSENSTNNETVVPDNSSVLHGLGTFCTKRPVTPRSDDGGDQSARWASLNALSSLVLADYTPNSVHKEHLTHSHYPEKINSIPLHPNLCQDLASPHNNLQVTHTDTPHTIQMLHDTPSKVMGATTNAATCSSTSYVTHSGTDPSVICRSQRKNHGRREGFRTDVNTTDVNTTDVNTTGPCGESRDETSTTGDPFISFSTIFPSFREKRKSHDALGKEYAAPNCVQRPVRYRPSSDGIPNGSSGNGGISEMGAVTAERVQGVLSSDAAPKLAGKVCKGVHGARPRVLESTSEAIESQQAMQAFQDSIQQKYALLLEHKDREIAQLKEAAARLHASDTGLRVLLQGLQEENKRLVDCVNGAKYSISQPKQEMKNISISPDLIF